MASVTIDLVSVSLTTTGTGTVYSPTQYFTVPDNAGINSVRLLFGTTKNSGSNTDDRAALVGGSRAHASNQWAVSSMYLDTSRFAAGSNSFRMTLRSTSSVKNEWRITGVQLVIDYNLPSGGGSGGVTGNFSINKTVMEAGETVIAHVDGVPGYWHEVAIKVLGRQFVQYPLDNQTYDMYTTVDLSWLTALPNATYTTLTATCTQYVVGDNTRQNPLWTRTLSCRVNVPPDIVPTIGSFDVTRVANGVPGDITAWVQGYSKAQLDITGAAGAYGSTIKSYRLEVGSLSANTASAELGPLMASGDLQCKAIVTDSRGRTAEQTVDITVQPYGPPTLTAPEVWRSDSDGAQAAAGSYVRLKAQAGYYSIDSQNSLTLEGRVYPRGSTPPDWVAMTSNVAWLAGNGELLASRSYVAEIRAKDKLNEALYQRIIPTNMRAWHFRLIGGVLAGAFGKFAERAGVIESTLPIVAPTISQANMLHNWDMRNPVNQRGVSGLISTAGYFLDRWILVSGQVTVNAGSLGFGANAEIEQRIESTDMAGKQATVSLMDDTGIIREVAGVFPAAHGSETLLLSGFGTVTFGHHVGSPSYLYVRIKHTGSGATVAAVKLEQGLVGTLGADGPARIGGELSACQRFYFDDDLNLFGTAYAKEFIRLTASVPVPMRIVPTYIGIATIDGLYAGDGTSFNATVSGVNGANESNQVYLLCTTTATLSTRRIVGTVLPARIKLNADL